MKVHILAYLQGLEFLRSKEMSATSPPEFITKKFNVGNYLIRPLTKEEMKEYKERYNEHIPARFGCEVHLDADEKEYTCGTTLDVNPLIDQTIFPMITAFRIFKSGYVNAYPINAEIWLDNARKPYILGQKVSLTRQTRGYILSGEEIKRFKTLFSDILKVLDTSPISKFPELVLFNKGVDDSQLHPDFSIVDFIGALESLALVDVEHRFKLSLMISTLTGNTPEKRGDVFDYLKLAYDARSQLVHNGIISDKINKKLEGKKMQLEDIARRALKTYIKYRLIHKNKVCLADDIESELLGKKSNLRQKRLNK